MSALSTAASKSASAKTTLGFLPPSSSATFFTVAAAAAITRRPVTMPPVNETRSTSGASVSAGPTRSPAPSTRLATPGGTPASVSAVISQIAVDGVSSHGLSTKVLPAASAGATFQTGLEQRVVPRRDQRADPDRLVHHLAGHPRHPRVDDPAGVQAWRARRSAGRPRRCRRRRSVTRRSACRCRSTRAGRSRPSRPPSGRPPGAAPPPAPDRSSPARVLRRRHDAPRRPPRARPARRPPERSAPEIRLRGSGCREWLRRRRPATPHR